MTQALLELVFISYSRRDNAVMRRLVAYLRNQGIKVWVDNEKLTPGTPIWEEEIEKAIRAASAVVAIMSPEAKNSEWVRREISLADQNRKRIFPVLVNGDEDTSITLRLITRQFVDLRQEEATGLAVLYDALSHYFDELKSTVNEQIESSKSIHEMPDQIISEKVSTELYVKGEAEIVEIEKPRFDHMSQSEIPWVVLGWVIAGAISGFMYSEYGEFFGGAIGGGIGGLIMALDLKAKNRLSTQKNMALLVLAWAISGVVGWLIGWWWLSEPVGAGIGMAFFVVIGLASTLGMEYIRFYWKSIVKVTLVWAIGGGIGWLISRGMIDGPGISFATSWAVGTSISWGIGGYAITRQMMKR